MLKVLLSKISIQKNFKLSHSIKQIARAKCFFPVPLAKEGVKQARISADAQPTDLLTYLKRNYASETMVNLERLFDVRKS